MNHSTDSAQRVGGSANLSVGPSPTRDARIAGIAALVASVGDLLLLYVANSQRGELGLPEVGRAWLWLGGIAGVLSIPLYAFGYRAASALVAPASTLGARGIVLAGAAVAVFGSAIHGLTTVHIASQLDAATSVADPLESLVGSGPLLLTLWGLSALLVLLASSLFAWFVGRGATAAPRSAAFGNPALLSVALGVAGLPSVLLGSFLTPAAPNIAHVIFFIVCAQHLRNDVGART